MRLYQFETVKNKKSVAIVSTCFRCIDLMVEGSLINHEYLVLHNLTNLMDVERRLDEDADPLVILIDRGMSSISYKSLCNLIEHRQHRFVSVSFSNASLCNSPYHLFLSSTAIELLAVNHNILYFFYMNLEYLGRHLSIALDAYNISYEKHLLDELGPINDINEDVGVYVIGVKHCLKSICTHMATKKKVMIYYSSSAQLRILVNGMQAI